MEHVMRDSLTEWCQRRDPKPKPQNPDTAIAPKKIWHIPDETHEEETGIMSGRPIDEIGISFIHPSMSTMVQTLPDLTCHYLTGTNMTQAPSVRFDCPSKAA